MESTIRAELAVAARAINAEFHRLHPDDQARVEPELVALEPRELDNLERGEALAVICDWRDRNLSTIAQVTR